MNRTTQRNMRMWIGFAEHPTIYYHYTKLKARLSELTMKDGTKTGSGLWWISFLRLSKMLMLSGTNAINCNIEGCRYSLVSLLEVKAVLMLMKFPQTGHMLETPWTTRRRCKAKFPSLHPRQEWRNSQIRLSVVYVPSSGKVMYMIGIRKTKIVYRPLLRSFSWEAYYQKNGTQTRQDNKENETLELGVGEEKSFDSNTNMILERGMKCPKAMKDTLSQLFENVGFDVQLMKNLNVVGLLTFGT